MMRTALMILGAALWGLLVFVIGLRVNFPSDEALARLRYEVWRSSDGKYALEASGASLAFPLSLSLSDVTVYKVDKARKTVRRHRKKNGRTDDDDVPEEEPLPKATTWLQFEQLDASIGLLDLLAGKQALTFDTELYGGDLGGTVVLGEGSTHIDIEGADIDLSTMNPSGDEWNLVLAGLAALDVELDQDAKDAKASTGTVSLLIDGLAFQSGKVMGMDIPATAFSESVLKMEVKGGKAEITEGHFASPLVDATLEGNITLAAKEMSRWRLRVTMKLKLGEEIDTLARMVPMLKNARDEDGLYHLICTGTMSSPTCREDRSVPAVRANTGGGPGAGLSPGLSPSLGGIGNTRDEIDAESGEAPLDQEERRKARLERIRERRERMRKAREERGDEPMRGPGIGPDGPRPNRRNPVDMDEFPPPDEDMPPGLDEGPIDEDPDDRDVLPNEE